jgi:hypothetical protein
MTRVTDTPKHAACTTIAKVHQTFPGMPRTALGLSMPEGGAGSAAVKYMQYGPATSKWMVTCCGLSRRHCSACVHPWKGMFLSNVSLHDMNDFAIITCTVPSFATLFCAYLLVGSCRKAVWGATQ